MLDVFGSDSKIERRATPLYAPAFSDLSGYWEITKANSKKEAMQQLSSGASDYEDSVYFIKTLIRVWPDLEKMRWDGYVFSRGSFFSRDAFICGNFSCEFYMLDGPTNAFFMVIRD